MVTRWVKRSIEAASRGYFISLVEKAYARRNSDEHKKIMALAKIWYGIERSNSLSRFFSRWYMDFVFQAQRDIFHSRCHTLYKLGISEIGVGKLKILCSAGDSNSSVVYLLGFSDNLTFFDIYQLFATSSSLVVDVGANMGMHSLVLSCCVGPKGKVLAFEPRKDVCAKLQENVNLNGIDNITVSEKAVGDSITTQRFGVVHEDFNIGKSRVSERGSQQIEMTTLNDECGGSTLRVSLIKIDTEGYEIKVLQGAAQVLANHRPVLVCEFNPHAYSYDELKRCIPYDAHIFVMPDNYHDFLSRAENHLDRVCDLLIVPIEKLTQDVQAGLAAFHRKDKPSCRTSSRCHCFKGC